MALAGNPTRFTRLRPGPMLDFEQVESMPDEEKKTIVNI